MESTYELSSNLPPPLMEAYMPKKYPKSFSRSKRKKLSNQVDLSKQKETIIIVPENNSLVSNSHNSTNINVSLFKINFDSSSSSSWFTLKKLLGFLLNYLLFTVLPQ